MDSKMKYRLPSTVSSSYWKIPDSDEYLSALATHETEPLIAVASGSKECNLFIYELDSPDSNSGTEENVLTHHQTVTLPGIHSIAWASPMQTLGGYGNVLATGHNLGKAHLTLLPEPYSNQPAEILRRYDHKIHIHGGDSVGTRSLRVKNINILSRNWTCCPDSSIMTLFDEHIFLWDPARSDKPVLKKKSRGTVSLDPSSLRDGILAYGGRKGVSITDLRVKDSPALSPPVDNDTFVSQVKWSPIDENLVAAVHDYMTVKVWDIRAGGPLVTLSGHNDRVNAVHWPGHDSNELITGSSDGTVRMWNIKNCIDLQSSPAPAPALMRRQQQHRSVSSPVGAPALSSSPKTAELNWLPKPWQQYRQRMSRQDEVCTHMSYFLEMSKHKAPSTTVFSDSKEFVGLASVAGFNSVRVGSIDSDGYFGLHSRDATRPLSVISSDTDAENSLFSSNESVSSASSSASSVHDELPNKL